MRSARPAGRTSPLPLLSGLSRMLTVRLTAGRLLLSALVSMAGLAGRAGATPGEGCVRTTTTHGVTKGVAFPQASTCCCFVSSCL